MPPTVPPTNTYPPWHPGTQQSFPGQSRSHAVAPRDRTVIRATDSVAETACAAAATAATYNTPRTMLHPPQLPPHSQRAPHRCNLLAFLPGRPIVMDMCVTHPLAAAAFAAPAWTSGAAAEAKDALKRNQYSRTSAGARRFVPLSHETCGHACPEAFALLNEIVEYAAGI